MDIKVDIPDLAQLIRAFQRAPESVKREMQLATRASMTVIADRARSEHRFKSRSGNLERAVDTELVSDWPPVGRVFLDPAITMTDSGKSYGVYVHDGTPPHVIRPRNKKALRWVSGGAFKFARSVNHPGTSPDRFVYEAADKERQNINDIFARYTDRAIKGAGL